MIGNDLLGGHPATDRQFANSSVLERNESGLGLGPDCEDPRSNESSSRLWGSSGSPVDAKYSSSASPILRFALNSPSDQFHSNDYINKLLGDDPLLHSPASDSNNLIVDNNGELVLPGGVSPMGVARFNTFGEEAGAPGGPSSGVALSSGSGEAFARTSVGLLLDEKKSEQMLDFILPDVAGSSKRAGREQGKQVVSQQFGSSTPRTAPGTGASGTLAKRCSTAKKMGNNNCLKGVVKSEKKVAAVRKTKATAAARNAAGLSAAPAAAGKPRQKQDIDKTGRIQSGKAGAAQTRPVGQSALNKLAILSGTKRFRSGGGGGGSARKSADAEHAAHVPHYTDEELKRIRRVKNRASVEKCRTKQRKRMESLEIELQMLQEENSNLLAVTKCVVSTFDVISRDVVAITGAKPLLHG